MTRDTGFIRNYREDIYVQRQYPTDTQIWFVQSPDIDDRFNPKERELGLLSLGRAKAYPYFTMQQNSVVNDNFDGENVVIVYWQESAVAVPFRRTVDGR